MTISHRLQSCFMLFGFVLGVLAPANLFAIQDSATVPADSVQEKTVRLATFNISFNRDRAGMLKERLAEGKGKNFERIAKIIQRVRPDVILLNEFDYDKSGEGVQLFQEHFLGKAHDDLKPINYPHTFIRPVNTGVDSGLDMDHDGVKKTGADAYGYGKFPGQYGMAVLSKYPLLEKQARTFQNFLWKDMPDALVPIDPESGKPYFHPPVMEVFRLSSKSHWDVPVSIDGAVVHFLVAHPTPPTFDGPEDRNGKRNHDEIRMLADYVGGKAEYLYDDNGKHGGLADGEHFVIAGDLNADPVDGASHDGAAAQLLDHPAINAAVPPKSSGGTKFAALQGRKNSEQKGDPANDTSDFTDRTVGNLRVDYCLPSKTLEVKSQAVFWPEPDDPEADWVKATDHRMVYIDVAIPK